MYFSNITLATSPFSSQRMDPITMRKFYLLLFAATIVSSLIVWFARNHTGLERSGCSSCPGNSGNGDARESARRTIFTCAVSVRAGVQHSPYQGAGQQNVIAIHVHEGEEVHQGDIVAQIDPRLYQAAPR